MSDTASAVDGGWELHGDKHRGMTPTFDLCIEQHDDFTWRWFVRDSEFGDMVATGHASDIATAKAAAVQVALLMESDC